MSENFNLQAEKKVLSAEQEQAIAEIRMIMQACQTMGANDYEIPTLMGLESQVRAGSLEPQTALAKAQTIINSKQDYH